MDWPSIPEGPAGMISDLVLANDVADYVRFRAVCRPWRQCSADPSAHGILDRRFLPRKWIMLREKPADADSDPDRRRLMNVATGQCVRAHLPELLGHDVCAPTIEGLLVLLNTTTYGIRLLNPITRHVCDLPPATALYSLYKDMYDYECHASADPRQDFEVSGAGLADDATVAVLFEEIHMLVVARPGDDHWTPVDRGDRRWSRVEDKSFTPAISFAGRFYCTTNWSIKTVDTRTNRLVVAAKLKHGLPGIASTLHLLDNDGELLFLTRSFMRGAGEAEAEVSTAESRYFMQYKVCRVDLDARRTRPIRGLGGRAVFIGYSRTISVSSSTFPTVTKDSVYLGKDRGFGTDIESTGPYGIVGGRGATVTMSFGEASSIVTEAWDFDSNGKHSVPRYGPRSIVDYLSQYVTTDRHTPHSDDAQGDTTTDSDAETTT